MIKSKIYLLLLMVITSLFTVSCKQEVAPVQEAPQQRDLLDNLNDLIASEQLNPELRYERAKLLSERGMYNEAIEDMRVAMLQDSMNNKYYHLLSDLFMDSNNSSKSLLVMQQAGKLFPDSTLTQLKLSETYYILRQYNESVFVLNEILRLHPNNAEAYLMLGLNFRALGESQRAINAFQTATEKNPKMIDAWIILGEIFTEMKEPIALRYYDAALNVDPENVNALHSKAFYLQNHDDIAGALELYRKINLIEPKYTDAYLNAGILMIEQDSLDSALEQFDIMTKMAPLNPVAYYFKALTNQKLGRIDLAKKDVMNALNFDPEYQQAKELLEKLNAG
ncbi:MAG: tetratricopeptide repeat protein [Saprospiraceae bacterium]|nr:tetratricopeptide repeat protein [Saprospiraceae bacterium]